RRLRDRGTLGRSAAVPDRLRGHLRLVLHARRRGLAVPLPEASAMNGFPWLSWIIFFPLFSAVLVALLPPRAERMIRILPTPAAAASVAESLFGLPLWWRLARSRPGWQLAEERTWLPALGATSRLGVAGTSSLLVLLTVVLTAVAVIGAYTAVGKRPREFYAL